MQKIPLNSGGTSSINCKRSSTLSIVTDSPELNMKEYLDMLLYFITVAPWKSIINCSSNSTRALLTKISISRRPLMCIWKKKGNRKGNKHTITIAMVIIVSSDQAKVHRTPHSKKFLKERATVLCYIKTILSRPLVKLSVMHICFLFFHDNNMFQKIINT